MWGPRTKRWIHPEAHAVDAELRFDPRPDRWLRISQDPESLFKSLRTLPHFPKVVTLHSNPSPLPAMCSFSSLSHIVDADAFF